MKNGDIEQSQLLWYNKAMENSFDPEVNTVETEPQTKGGRGGHTLLKVMTYLIPAVFLLGFAAFAFFSDRTEIGQLVFDAISVLFFIWLTVSMLPTISRFRNSEDRSPTEQILGERSRRRLRPTFAIVMIALSVQLFVVFAAHLLDSLANGFSGTVFRSYSRLFITSHGLVFGENTRALIGTLGALSAVLPSNLELTVVGSGLVLPLFLVNTAAVCALAPLMYELLLFDFDKKSSKFGVWVLLVSPTILLLLQPLSGTAMFFLFTVWALLLARKGKLLFAGLMAALSCLFNIAGLLLIVPLIMEGIAHCVKTSRDSERPITGAVIGCINGALLPLAVCAAAVLYCKLNGSAFKPLSLRPCFFFEPLGQLFASVKEGVLSENIQLLFIGLFAAVGVLAAFAVRKQRASYAIYTILFAAIVPSLMGAVYAAYSVFVFPLLPALESAVLSRKFLRTAYTVLMAIVTMLFLFFLFIKRAV